jgi:hypothetical protein
MRFRCKVERQAGGAWSVRYLGADLGEVSVVAPTREQALQKMRGELRYRLELCPCSGELYQDVEVELVEE